MHCCDSIRFELLGTDSFHYGRNDNSIVVALKDLQLNREGCEFCVGLAKLIFYRLHQDTTWSPKYRGAPSGRRPERPTEEEMENAKVYLYVHGWKECRNWSFGFGGLSYRTVLDVTVQAGLHSFGIMLQRAGPGGRVPLTHKSETEYGDSQITYIDPGSWRMRLPGDAGPRGGEWTDRPATTAASLDTALGRPRPLEVDYAMLRGWMDMCSNDHKFCHDKKDGLAAVSRLRLVDIKEMCIVEIEQLERLEFATLSYVWGQQHFVRHTRENTADLRSPGSLYKLKPPLTICDALKVCQNLQIRYIWIDSLCIIQDDEADVIEMIDNMDWIYGQSILTIVAAAGVDAHAGIPGVRPGTRFLEQHMLEARGVQLIDSVDDKQLRTQSQFQEPEWIAETPWAQRAWTFQEALLSRRLLLFTAEQVYWSCREGLLSEDTVEYFHERADGVRSLDDEFDPLEYQRIAVTFSKRRLTYESDMARAYLGTQSYLSKKWGGQGFTWGLPYGSFGSFLMWEWQFDRGRRPRQGTHPIKHDNRVITRVAFPTWSWMGWREGGQLIDFYGDESDGHSPSFYTFSGASQLVAIQDGEHWRSRPKKLADLLMGHTETGLGGETMNWETEIRHSDIPQELSSTPSLKHSALLFYSQTAIVRYDSKNPTNPDSGLGTPSDLKMVSQKYPFSIMIGDSFYRIMEDHQVDDQENNVDLKEVKLVSVFAGQMTKPRKFRGKFRLYAWPIVEKNGLWVRASYMSTVVFLDCWELLPRRKWELVCII